MEDANKYQVMPPLSDEEYQALKEDIAENGVQVPVVLDADGTIIDGYHRVQARQELRDEGHDVPPHPTTTRSDLTTDDQKRALAWRLNMQRRHLSQAQKREAIAAKLKESPEWADRRIARLLGVDHKTVRNVRTYLETGKEVPKVELLEGKDGKYYPRESIKTWAPIKIVERVETQPNHTPIQTRIPEKKEKAAQPTVQVPVQVVREERVHKPVYYRREYSAEQALDELRSFQEKYTSRREEFAAEVPRLAAVFEAIENLFEE